MCIYGDVKNVKGFGFRMMLINECTTCRSEMVEATTLKDSGSLRGSAHDEYNQLDSPEVFFLRKKKRSESNFWVFHRDF